jgi:hypothetical protein
MLRISLRDGKNIWLPPKPRKTMSQQAKAEIVIDLPRAQAWEKLRDLSMAHHYVPGLVKTEIVSEQAEGIGASRYVYRNEKSYIQETVTEWQEGEGFLIRLHKGDKPAAPFKEAWFRYHLADHSSGDGSGDSSGDSSEQTLFTASLGYQMPWGAVGNWLGGRMLGFVQSTVADVATAMKLYYETGNPTTPEALKAYKKSVV